MKKLVSFFLIAALATGFAQSFAATCTYVIDLTKTKDDMVPVEVQVSGVTSETIEYHLPKVVPGTYSVSDFGRFIQKLEATDESGNRLPVESVTVNRWKISDAKKLRKISYWVEDTWDSMKENHVFEPGGTNIEEGENFVINTFGFLGYLEGEKENPATLRIIKPTGFYGSTALIAKSTSDTEDVYEVRNYHHLADSPLMYCLPDTSIRKVGGADVLVSVYSPNKRVSAEAIMADIAEILAAQKDYLGGTLPVEKYAFIIYLTPGTGGSGGMGALEHSNSSLYFMPETDEDAAGGMMRDVAAHEFFHIVTPLSVHSEEIHYFNYIDPKMSKHLWLYEGVTEYSAGHVQVTQGLITKGDYLNILRNKITMAGYFLDTVPFTEISAGCLDQYKSQYFNVYQKGALIGMALDIELRKHSEGKMGLQDMMRKLEKSYGKDQPFKDDELFDKIASLSDPAIREFFRKHVEGPEPLPFDKIFREVGVTYEATANRKVLSMGRVAMKLNRETGRFRVENTSRMNKMGKQLGYQVGDEIVEWDGMEVTAANYDDVIAQYRKKRKAGDKILVVVARKQSDGSFKNKTLKAKAVEGNLRGMNVLTIDPDATEKQIALRNAWLGAN